MDIILSWDIKSYDWKPEKAIACKIHLTSHSFLLILWMQLSYRRQEAVSQSDCLTTVPNSRNKDGENRNKYEHINQKKFHLPPQKASRNLTLFHKVNLILFQSKSDRDSNILDTCYLDYRWVKSSNTSSFTFSVSSSSCIVWFNSVLWVCTAFAWLLTHSSSVT